MGRNKSEKCSHCKKSEHTSDRCWVLHPHLKPRWKGDGGNRGQGEVAKKNTKTLDGRQEEKRGFLAKGEASESEIIPEASRLDRIESQLLKLTELMGQQMERQTCPQGLSNFDFYSRPNISNKVKKI